MLMLLNAICSNHILDFGFQCLAVHPPSPNVGYEYRNSRHRKKRGRKTRRVTSHIAQESRLNAANILTKGLDAVTSQYSDVSELQGDLNGRED